MPEVFKGKQKSEGSDVPDPNNFLSEIFIDVRRQTSESLEKTSLGKHGIQVS